MPKPKLIKIGFPFKGLDVSNPVGVQPESSTPDCLNVRAVEGVTGRVRGGQRPGIAKWTNVPVNGSTSIQHILPTVSTVLAADTYAGRVAFMEEIDATNVMVLWVRESNGDAAFSVSFGDIGTRNPATAGRYTAFDNEGNVFAGVSTTLAGATIPNCSVAKVGPAGAVLWKALLGSATDGEPGGIVCGMDYNRSLGLLAVATAVPNTDWTGAAGSPANIFLIDARNGLVAWHYSIGDSAASSPQVCGIHLDDDGAVYVHAYPSAGLTDWAELTGQTAQTVWKVTPTGIDQGSWSTTNTDTSAAVDWTYLGIGAALTTGQTTFIVKGLTSGQDYYGTVKSGSTMAILQASDGAESATLTGIPQAVTGLAQDLNDPYGMVFSKDDDACCVWGGPSQDDFLACAYVASNSAAWDGAYTKIFILDRIENVGTTNLHSMSIDSSDNVYLQATTQDEWEGETTEGAMNTFKVTKAGSLTWNFKFGTSGSFSVGGGVSFELSTTTARRFFRTFAVSGGSIYEVTTSGGAILTGGSAALVTGEGVQGVYAFQKVFYVDGTNDKYIDMTDSTVYDWSTAVTGGTLPALARMIALYRGRVVLSGRLADPHNWYMSKVGDPLDWDYAPATTTPTQAVAGNNSDAGKVGDVVTCLAPYSDDMMIIGCDHTLWLMRGDPAAGGAIDNVSYQTGIVGKDAYSYDHNGNLFFYGQSTVYRMPMGGGSMPESISTPRMDRIFAAIDIGVNDVRMMWDRDSDQLHVFFSPATQPSTASFHYVWDSITDSWWRDQYPAAMGPFSFAILDADKPDDRAVLLGGYDSYIYNLTSEASDDDGTSISSYVVMGPFAPAGIMFNSKLNRITTVTAADGNPVTLEVYADESPEAVLASAAPAFSKALVAGRNQPIIQRAGGNAFKFKLVNADAANQYTWAFEELEAIFTPQGRQRYGRL